MRRIALLIGLGIIATAGPASADEKDAKAIVQRAITSHGGAEALTKAQRCKRVDKGKQAVRGEGKHGDRQ